MESTTTQASRDRHTAEARRALAFNLAERLPFVCDFAGLVTALSAYVDNLTPRQRRDMFAEYGIEEVLRS